MLRIIAGIILGWIVSGVLVIATFAVAIRAIGWDNIFQPNSYWTTDTFNITVLIGGSFASIVGGVVCALLARNAKAAYALAALILAFGIAGAMSNIAKPDPPARTDVPTFEDMATHGKEPTWFAFSKVALGAVGVLIGSSLVLRRRGDARG